MTRKLSTPFAVNSTLINQVPVSQTSDSQASYDIGFPPKNFQTIANGGVAVDGKDFNGLLNDITGNIVDINKGLPQYYDDAYATLIGGYPLGARLMLNDNSSYAVSLSNNNINDPNSNLTGWIVKDFNSYDFKTAQPVQYYYDKLGNWDDAIFEAQCNIIAKGYSPELLLPNGLIKITKPIFGGQGFYEKLQKERPDIANSISDSSKMPPLILIGAHRMTEGYLSESLGTQIILTGINGTDDKTWANFGIVHCASQDPEKIRNNEFASGSRCIIKHLNVMAGEDAQGNLSIHGIVINRHNQHIVDDVTVYSVYGAGLYLDWIFDSSFTRLVFIKCGRMSPKYGQYMTDNKTDIQYQTYAPLHIVRSADDKADNTNFVYFDKLHFEDNNDCNADIIVSGNADPVVMRNLHHEADKDFGIASRGNKSCFAIGNFGVKYFGQDQESNFDYTNFSKPDYTGYITVYDARLYKTGYSSTGYGSSWSTAKLINCQYELPYFLDSLNSSGRLHLSNTVIGDFIHTGFTDRGYLLDAVNSTIGNIQLGKGNGSGGGVLLTSCDCGDMSIGSSAVGDWAKNIEIRVTNTSFTSISGNYPNFFGDIKLTSANQASTLNVLYKADLDIRSYNFLETAGE